MSELFVRKYQNLEFCRVINFWPNKFIVLTLSILVNISADDLLKAIYYNSVRIPRDQMKEFVTIFSSA